jgi:hypothetical protein
VILPSGIGGAVTQEVGWFHHGPAELAEWVHEGLGGSWRSRRGSFTSASEVFQYLAPSVPMSRYVVASVGDWSVVLNNGPRGTDMGVLPSHAARDLGCRAVRAVCVEDGEGPYPARIWEVYGPDGAPPLKIERSVVAANDGGQWVFEVTGIPFAFEDESQYGKRLKAQRLTCAMVHDYLRSLGVSFDGGPDWTAVQVLEFVGGPSR